jgi:hypothetical protein
MTSRTFALSRHRRRRTRDDAPRVPTFNGVHWSCPSGYEHPRCRCGTVLYDRKPVPSVDADTTYQLCWSCYEEEHLE